MKCYIDSIEIISLFGLKDYKIKFVDNKLILVGENGVGKTTVSRMICATLSCNWKVLQAYNFKKIIIHFIDEHVTIKSEFLKKIYSSQQLERIYNSMQKNSSNENIQYLKIRADEDETDVLFSEFLQMKLNKNSSSSYFRSILKETKIEELLDISRKIRDNFDTKIIYLPTYRRIEEQIMTIFPNINEETLLKFKKSNSDANAVELVEFGMSDVEELVKQEEFKLKSKSQSEQNQLTLGYLSEIVDKNYENDISVKKIKKLSDKQIKLVLSRIDSKILTATSKEKVIKILKQANDKEQYTDDTQVKIVSHYFLKLIDFNDRITSSEQRIRDFSQICNKYLVNNELQYNSKDFSCQIHNKISVLNGKDRTIHFQDLSSGEKQIVSLFSHLYLEQNENIFVFIDEPELSLSVDWQRTFLPNIVNSPNCVGLMATTHSPFIFDNELEEYVHGMNEFCTRG